MFINVKCDRNNPAGNWSFLLHHSDIRIMQFICNSSEAYNIIYIFKDFLKSHASEKLSTVCIAGR